MDVSAFNLATAGAMSDEGIMAVPGAAVAGGDAFARLLSGLGVAPAPATADAPPLGDMPLVDAATVDGETPPVDPALLLTGNPAALAVPRAPKGEGAKPQIAAANDEREPVAETETPTAASLGLPPLLAALVAPTLAQAAPPAPTVAADRPAVVDVAAVTLPAIGGAAAPIAAQSPAVTPENSASAGTTPQPSAAPLSIPAPDTSAPAVATFAPATADPFASASTVAVAPVASALVQPGSEAAELGQPAAAMAGVAAKADAAPATAARSAPAAEASPERPAEAVAATLPGATLPTLQTPPRRVSLTQPGRADAVEPSKRSEKASPIIDIASPLPARPVAAAAPLPVPFDVATASAAAPAAATEAPAPAEQIIERQLDMAQEGEWLDQLTRDIVRTASAESSLRFKLNPEHLGSLQVEVMQGQAGASVRLTADSEQARAIIADARPQLIAEARAQGLRISEAQVDLNGQGQGHSQAQAQAGNGGRSGREGPAQEYLTSWQPESVEEKATPSRRSTAERYA